MIMDVAAPRILDRLRTLRKEAVDGRQYYAEKAAGHAAALLSDDANVASVGTSVSLRSAADDIEGLSRQAEVYDVALRLFSADDVTTWLDEMKIVEEADRQLSKDYQPVARLAVLRAHEAVRSTTLTEDQWLASRGL